MGHTPLHTDLGITMHPSLRAGGFWGSCVVRGRRFRACLGFDVAALVSVLSPGLCNAVCVSGRF